MSVFRFRLSFPGSPVAVLRAILGAGRELPLTHVWKPIESIAGTVYQDLVPTSITVGPD